MNKFQFDCRKPENVDVYTGALSEPPLDGAIVGPLIACLLTDQFLRLKRGDSHWYERPMGPQSFTRGILFIVIIIFLKIRVLKNLFFSCFGNRCLQIN